MRQVPSVEVPKSGNAKLKVQGREVALTNLDKPFWPELGITKGDLIQYYADVAPVLLPHIEDRAMVMKRYPHGAHGEFFFMKRAPDAAPRRGSAPAVSITTPGTSSTFRSSTTCRRCSG